MRTPVLLVLLLLATGAVAHPANPDPARLPPPVQRVLDELSIDADTRAKVRELLQVQRERHIKGHEKERAANHAELRKLLNQDQTVAVEAALPKPGHGAVDPGEPQPAAR